MPLIVRPYSSIVKKAMNARCSTVAVGHGASTCEGEEGILSSPASYICSDIGGQRTVVADFPLVDHKASGHK